MEFATEQVKRSDPEGVAGEMYSAFHTSALDVNLSKTTGQTASCVTTFTSTKAGNGGSRDGFKDNAN